MEELYNLLDHNRAEQPDLSHESTQHRLNEHFPFKGSKYEEDGLKNQL